MFECILKFKSVYLLGPTSTKPQAWKFTTTMMVYV